MMVMSKYEQFLKCLNRSGQMVLSKPHDITYDTSPSGYTIFIFFSHTRNTLKDWLYNIIFKKTEYEEIDYGYPLKIHSGFLSIYKEIQPDLMKLITKSKPKKIILSGYSQGAGVASIAHADITTKLDIKVKTNLFGSPRVFGWDTGEDNKLFQGLTRYNVEKDIVPHLPPWLFGFSHVGEEVKLETSNDPWWSFWPKWRNHYPRYYLKGLEDK